MATLIGTQLKVLPAYAGMIPASEPSSVIACSAPRVCGDDPLPYTVLSCCFACSPRMRG